jgi:hypothetical protein
MILCHATILCLTHSSLTLWNHFVTNQLHFPISAGHHYCALTLFNHRNSNQVFPRPHIINHKRLKLQTSGHPTTYTQIFMWFKYVLNKFCITWLWKMKKDKAIIKTGVAHATYIIKLHVFNFQTSRYTKYFTSDLWHHFKNKCNSQYQTDFRLTWY